MKCFNTSVNIKKNYIVIRYSGALFTARYYSLSPFLEIFFSSLVHQLALQLISRPNGVLLVSKKACLLVRLESGRVVCPELHSEDHYEEMNVANSTFLSFLSLSLFLFFFLFKKEGEERSQENFRMGFFRKGGGGKKLSLNGRTHGAYFQSNLKLRAFVERVSQNCSEG